MTFAQRGIGDVLVSWENEAHLALSEFGADKFEIVTPSNSILAEPPVSLVDKVADRHKTRVVAEGYLNFLYSPLGQDLVGKNYLPAAQPYGRRQIRLSISQHSDGHHRRHLRRLGQGSAKTHFNDGGVFRRDLQACLNSERRIEALESRARWITLNTGIAALQRGHLMIDILYVRFTAALCSMTSFAPQYPASRSCGSRMPSSVSWHVPVTVTGFVLWTLYGAC